MCIRDRAQPGADLPDEGFVPVRRLPPQAVVDVADREGDVYKRQGWRDRTRVASCSGAQDTTRVASISAAGA